MWLINFSLSLSLSETRVSAKLNVSFCYYYIYYCVANSDDDNGDNNDDNHRHHHCDGAMLVTSGEKKIIAFVKLDNLRFELKCGLRER